MNASAKRTLRLGITAGLSLGAIIGLVGCGQQDDDADVDQLAAVESTNGLSVNGFAVNGLSVNGLSVNGMSVNGFSVNGLSVNGLSINGLSVNGMSVNGLAVNGLAVNGLAVNGLESTGGLSPSGGLANTPGGREILKYMVKVAYPAGRSLTFQDAAVPANTYTFDGNLGVAPNLEFGTTGTNDACDTACQEKVSGAMLAHVNNSGLHVSIWLDGPDTGIGWGSSPNYPFKEAGYFGNLFTSNMPGNYCAGKDMGSGDAKGRLGSPFGNNSAVLTSPYGWQWDGASSQNVPQYCLSGGCTLMNEGFSTCPDPSGNANHPRWDHVVTVWRNFEATQLYKICNKSSGKCLGVVNGSMTSGANVEQRAYDGRAGQTWKILQVSPGNYKIINKTSGMSLDVNGSQVVQRPYASQAFPITYLSDMPGFMNIKMASNPTFGFWNNWSTSDGGLVQTTNNVTTDCAKWTMTAVALDTFDPGTTYRLTPQNNTAMAVDVCANGSQSYNNCTQQYTWWGGDGQKFFIGDAGKGNVRFQMKANKNKCLGPINNATTINTAVVVQDCVQDSYTQAWINVQTTSTSGIFIYRNAANPNMCLDVTGAQNGGGNGNMMELYPCNGGLNQRFAATVAP